MLTDLSDDVGKSSHELDSLLGTFFTYDPDLRTQLYFLLRAPFHRDQSHNTEPHTEPPSSVSGNNSLSSGNQTQDEPMLDL
jgi:hypothetical protein